MPVTEAPPTLLGAVGPITFGEPEFPEGTPVRGHVVETIDGEPLAHLLSFDFSSSDATFTVEGPGPSLRFVNPPLLDGESVGLLTIDFGGDLRAIAFGFAVSCASPIVPAATVTALDSAGTIVDQFEIDALNFGGDFMENYVRFMATGPFRSIEIDPGAPCSRFGIDNLSYGAPVPVELQQFNVE